MSRLRAAGYRLLGPRLDYLLHLRPAEWPIVSVHFLTGTALAVGIGPAIRFEPPGLLVALLAWVIGLNGGTLAWNSAFDADDSDVAYLRAPPAPPRYLAPFALGLMAIGLAASLTLPPAFLAAYAVCFGLSIVYSAPPVRAKGIPGVDWAINLLGFGLLTPFAGLAATGRLPSRTEWLVLAAFSALFGALYPLTQLYQLAADARRGDRTFALALGEGRSLSLSLVTAAAAFALFAAAAAGSDWWGGPSAAPRLGALGVAAVAWGAVLVPWRMRAGRLAPAEQQRRMHHALAAWAVTDAAVLLAWGR